MTKRDRIRELTTRLTEDLRDRNNIIAHEKAALATPTIRPKLPRLPGLG
jgi:hypothetical protein